MFALNTMPIAATGAFPYATRIWFKMIVERLISMEKIAVGSPQEQTVAARRFSRLKSFGRMEKFGLFFTKYQR